MGKERVTKQFGSRVASRSELGRELRKPEYRARREAAGLLDSDLEAIVTSGEAAAEQDRVQHQTLADQRVELEQAREVREQFDDQVEELRDRIPLVTLTLTQDPATRQDGLWLAQDAFVRIRFRVTPPEHDGGADGSPTQPTRTAVVRTDRRSFAEQTAQLVESILERPAVVAAFAARGMDEATLLNLADHARRYATELGGRLQLSAVEATRLEAEAVARQKTYWNACRRAIRKAVAGDDRLARLFAAC